ncbi:MAG: hypothetical protein MJ168_08085 [Clostridia bacterium]|nr:hypothetical protein [Clostridia bacterium]
MSVYKPKALIATIDCCLVTVSVGSGAQAREIGFDTSDKVSVEPQLETQEAVKLIVKGILRAQKPKKVTITGNQITLKDNLFNPELVKILQGGTITEAGGKVTGYTPPLVGDAAEGEKFTLNCYSAQYDEAGDIVQYEKIMYPNCHGQPYAFGAEDGVFRASEYIINSAAKKGEAPYTITYVAQLPALTDPT